MRRAIHKLTPAFVERKSKRPGLHSDGGGLYLCVTPPSARSWVFRYMLDGKAREMGLGSYPELSLEGARGKAAEARALKGKGIDPIDARESGRASQRLLDAKAVTFRHCVESYIAAHKDAWRSAKHGKQWAATLESYAMPILGDVPVAKIDRAWSFGCWSRSGRQRPRPPVACAVVSWPSWIGQRRANIGMATIRLAGKAPFPSCSRPVPK